MNPLRFTLVKTSLIRLGCPLELQAKVANRVKHLPVVAVRNKKEYGKISSGYSPELVVVAGADRRRDLMANGIVRSWVWVENGAIEIKADDAISCYELMDKLSAAIVAKHYGPMQEPLMGQPYPSIRQVYPFENYLIYAMKGDTYRQHYNLDPVAREVRLQGGSVKVQEKFIDAAGETKQWMPRVQTGVHWSPAPPMGNTQSMSQGGAKSELVTCIVRNLSNIQSAVNQYLAVIGGAKKIPNNFAPVSLTWDGKINAFLNAKGVDAFEFAKWVVSAKDKKKKKPMKATVQVYDRARS